LKPMTLRSLLGSALMSTKSPLPEYFFLILFLISVRNFSGMAYPSTSEM
jgi:hypothetical protein